MMRRIWRLALLLVLGVSALAQSADEVVAKYIQARGGMERIKSVQSMRMTGTMTTGEVSVPITMLLKRPNLVRMEFEVQGVTNIRAYDGQNGWALMPFLGAPDPAPIEGGELRDLQNQADIDGVLVDAKAKGTQITLLGREKVGSVDAYKLKVTRKNGDVSTLYLDAATYLQIKEEGMHSVQGSEKEFETHISDYRDVNGLKFPYAISSGIKGMPQTQTLTIEKVELDVPADAAQFKMPAVKPGASR